MPTHSCIIFLLSELDPTFSAALRKQPFDIHTHLKMWSAGSTMVRILPEAWMSPSKCPFSFLTRLLPSRLIWTFKWKRMSSRRESIVCWSLHCFFFLKLSLYQLLFPTLSLKCGYSAQLHLWLKIDNTSDKQALLQAQTLEGVRVPALIGALKEQLLDLKEDHWKGKQRSRPVVPIWDADSNLREIIQIKNVAVQVNRTHLRSAVWQRQLLQNPESLHY